MHLRRNNRNQEQREQNEPVELVEPLIAKAEPEFDWNKLKLPKEVRDLAQQRKALAKKMQEIDNRLRFGYSEPLHDYKMELIKQDIALSCKITEVLIQA